jgi:hypothetical protein
MRDDEVRGGTGAAAGSSAPEPVVVPVWPTTAPPYTHHEDIEQFKKMRQLVDGANAIVSARREAQAPGEKDGVSGGNPPPAAPPLGGSQPPGGQTPRKGAALMRTSALVWDDSFEGLVEQLGPFLSNDFTLGAEKPLQNAGTLWFASLAGPPGVDSRSFEHLLLRNGGPPAAGPAAASADEIELEAIGPDGSLGPQFGPMLTDDAEAPSAATTTAPALAISQLHCESCSVPLGPPIAAHCLTCIRKTLELLRGQLEAEAFEAAARLLAGPTGLPN